MITRDFLLSELQKSCNNNRISLTSGIDFKYDEPKTLRLVMKDGIKKNMQEDAAAFEGWALAFKANLGEYIHRVILDWDVKNEPTDKTKSEWKHFNRFLYRVDRFEGIYGDWFEAVHKNRWYKQIKSEGWNILVLNRPGDRIAEDRKYTLKSEHSIEECLKKGDLLIKEITQYGITLGHLDNQFPVGVFNGSVEKGNAIFTGGKSAIDLYGEDKKNGSFNIFELKTERNVKIGIISELFFYTSIINDAIAGNIHWEGKTKMELDQINAFFLVPKLHPLITDEVIKHLNAVNGITYRKIIYSIKDISFE